MPLPGSQPWGEHMWSHNYRDTNRINCYDTGTAPCKTACPAHIAIQGYLKLAKEGRYEEALAPMERAINGEDPMRDKDLTYDLFDHYGCILLALGRKEPAYRAWEKAIDLMKQENDTDNPDYADIIARMKEIEDDVLKITEAAGGGESTDADDTSELNDVVEKMVK